MSVPIIPVILAGGSGTRLWPLSRQSMPKQFLGGFGEHTLFQQALLRGQGVSNHPPIVVCHNKHRFLVAEQARALGIDKLQIILEPEAKNTAPAIALAAYAVLKGFAPQEGAEQEPLMLVMPADHSIGDLQAFTQCIGRAGHWASQNKLVTLGIKPTRAETGFGYIFLGQALDSHSFTVAQFKEKPNAKLAKQYVEQEECVWNAGIFILPASLYLAELERFQPQIIESCSSAWAKRQSDLDFVRVDADALKSCPSESIDYAVMEHTANALVIKAEFSWNDLGSFDALYQSQQQDDSGNAIRGDVVTRDSHHNLIVSERGLVATLGIDNLVIVNTQDALLVAERNNLAGLRELVSHLSDSQREEVESHQRVYRPWGHYQLLEQGPGFKVKRIQVEPGGQLSLQLHQHRAEHWVVVSGIADIQIDDSFKQLIANQSLYISPQTKHSLANTQAEPLVVIEVQTGDTLSENDITRLADVYHR